MRKLFLLLAITFLFQSCFTYKQVDMNPSKMVIGEKYKIERNHKVSKVVLKSITDSSIVVSKGWKEKQIPLNEITNMRKRKLSVVKSVVMPLAVTASAVLVFALSFSPGMGEISLVKGSN